MRGFLYGQTEYNILSNAVNLTKYVELAASLQFEYLSITDSNLHGCLKFYNLCLKHNIKPIIGLELTITNNLEEDVFLLYPYNNEGLTNLFYIETINKTGTVDLNTLKGHNAGVFFVLVASKSFLTKSLVSLPEEALEKLAYYKNCFTRFYVGVSQQNPNLAKLNLAAVALARNLGILSVYLHQLKYLIKEDKIVYDLLKAIDNKVDNDSGDYTFFNPSSDFQYNNYELFQNTDNLVSEINYTITKKEVLPKYPFTNNPALYLEQLANKGLAKRLLNKNVDKSLYQERLNYELSIIKKMHYEDYFLIVWDFIKWAKKRQIFVGPGRGSAASSLVAYALGITEVCPLDYNLLFERFLNPERISMPDIDTDFPDNYRDDVINYVKETYGAYHVASITTFGTFSYKSSLRDVARIYKIDEKRIKELANLLAKNSLDDLLAMYEYQKDIYDVLYIIKQLDGLPRNTSTHAAGIIMAGCNLYDVIPLQKGLNGLNQTELEYDDLKQLGLLKMDFLGIRNLTIIANILEEAKISTYDFRNISLLDPKVYTLLSRADTLGLFQLESAGIRRVLLKLKPTKFTDLVAVLALYRPGPMDNIDEFIARRHGKAFTYLHPDLEPILKETYGIIVYQEQIILIATKFAGYSLGKADVLRRAISDKDLSKMEALRSDFVASATKRGYVASLAETIFDLIVKFANYGFNKAHSVAYALVSYEMAYLKTHYFGLFMANILNNVIGATETLASYIKYAKSHSLQVVGPNINISTTKFVYQNNWLYLPLTCVSGIGLQIASKIIAERTKKPFSSYQDFIMRLNLPESQVASLIYAGAFSDFKRPVKELIEHKTAQATLIDSLLGNDLIKDNSEYPEDILIAKEKEVLGFNLSYDPTKKIKALRLKNNKLALKQVKLNQNMVGVVKFSNLTEQKTKSKGVLLKGIMYDDTAELPFVIFSDLYQEIKSIINQKDIFLVGFNYKGNKDFAPTANVSFIKLIEN